MKKIFLYGAGGYGRAVFDAFIEHNLENMIVAVIDNNPGLKNASLFGKPIMPYSTAREMLDHDTTVIISVELETSMSISDQLKKDGVIRYVHWAYEQYVPFEEMIEITQEENDFQVYSHSLLLENKTIKNQKDYILEHCSPQNMKPATGEMRKKQLMLVDFAYEINILLGSASLHPFISSGNLLGLVRHGGFIPWDDDFDFTILRSEYIRMKEFLCGQFYHSKYNGPLNDDIAQLKWIREEMDNHPGETIILERPMLFRACKKSEGEEYLLLDFFPFDEFGEATAYEKRLSMLQKGKKSLTAAKSVADYDEVIAQIDKDDERFREENGAFLGFGYDVRESYSGSRYKRFIEREAVLPLKTVDFEGKIFYEPNDPDAFLRYEFGEDYMELPKSIGLHFSTDELKRITGNDHK